jgi:hypothetical protein
MRLVNNKDYLISEIRRLKDNEIESLKQKYNNEVEEIRQDFRKKHILELEKINDLNESSLKMLVKQKESHNQMILDKIILDAKEKIINDIINNVKKELSLKKSIGFWSKLSDRLSKDSLNMIKEFHTPKGIKIAKLKCRDILDDFKIIGIISEHEECELSFDSILSEKMLNINELLDKEIFIYLKNDL